jgi:hypothetical protein
MSKNRIARRLLFCYKISTIYASTCSTMHACMHACSVMHASTLAKLAKLPPSPMQSDGGSNDSILLYCSSQAMIKYSSSLHTTVSHRSTLSLFFGRPRQDGSNFRPFQMRIGHALLFGLVIPSLFRSAIIVRVRIPFSLGRRICSPGSNSLC